jgi:hypothetical protein
MSMIGSIAQNNNNTRTRPPRKEQGKTKSEQGDPNKRAWGGRGVGLAFARRNQEPSSLFSYLYDCFYVWILIPKRYLRHPRRFNYFLELLH